jgi:hypothetical protein
VDQERTTVDATLAQDPATRARDQLGALFFVLSIALACGAVAAGRDPHRSYLKHAVWWWVGWSLLMYTPALIFTLVPWIMRTALRMAPQRAAADATRAFYGLMGFVAALGVLDGLVTAASSEFPPRETAARILIFLVAPVVATAGALRVFKGKMGWLPVVLPLALFLNALLVEWAAGFAGKSFLF